ITLTSDSNKKFATDSPNPLDVPVTSAYLILSPPIYMYSNNEQLFPFLGQNYSQENFHLANVAYLQVSQILTIQSDVYISHLTIRQLELNLPCEQIQLLFQMLFDNFLQLG